MNYTTNEKKELNFAENKKIVFIIFNYVEGETFESLKLEKGYQKLEELLAKYKNYNIDCKIEEDNIKNIKVFRLSRGST